MIVLLLACMPRSAPTTSYRLVAGEEPGLWAQLVSDTPFTERIAPHDDADLIIFYGGEEKGSLDVCGCPDRPRGGLARFASFVDATREANPDTDTLIVNGGYWLDDAMGLDGQPRLDTPILNRWMITGLQQLGVDALNVGYNDMAGINSVGGNAEDLPLVSANVSGPGVRPFQIIDTQEISIGITGISAPGLTFLETPEFVVTDPHETGLSVLESLRSEVDIVILLAFQAPEAAKSLAASGLVDVIIDTNRHITFSPPFRQDGAIWVRSHMQSMRLGELRITFDGDRITHVIDRKIDMDTQIPGRPDLLRIATTARQELDAIAQRLYGL